jgi:hypothetical protein
VFVTVLSNVPAELVELTEVVAAFAFAGLALRIIHTVPMSALLTMSTAKPGGRHGDDGMDGFRFMIFLRAIWPESARFLTLRTARPQDYADSARAGDEPGVLSVAQVAKVTPQPSPWVVSEVRS